MPRRSPPKTAAGASAEVLDRRALNRALLARQLLLERSEMGPIDAMEHLVGMQSQAPTPPYFGLWTRLRTFAPEDLSRLIEEREAVRVVLMRGTIHLVSARDSLALRPLMQPVLLRALQGAYGKPLERMDMTALEAAGRALVDEKPRTFAELGARLAERWPDRDPAALAQGVRCLVALVQVPPRGLWGASGQATHTSAEAWLGRAFDADPSPDEMVLRYLRAFGPASVADAQAWSGLTRLREAMARLRPRLVTFRDERGAELFDLPDAPRPGPDAPAPVRFLPEWDNILLSHADRTRILAAERRKAIFTINGLIRTTILLDGFVAGTWKIAREKGAATLAIDPFQPLSKPHRAALADEGARLLAFAAPEETHDVRFGGAMGI
jgi:hypothetical protein